MKALPHSVCISLADRVDRGPPSMPAIARLLGMVSVGASATSAVLSGGILAQLRDCKSAQWSDSNPMAHGDGSGPKRHWLFAFDVTEGSQNDFPLALSSAALEQGWTGIERTPAESMDSTDFERLLREDFYGGKTFRQLMNEPLLYGVATWVVVAYLAFMMRDEIGEEWTQLRREVSEPKWLSDYGDDWSDNRDGIVAQIRSRFAHWIDERKILIIWATFML